MKISHNKLKTLVAEAVRRYLDDNSGDEFQHLQRLRNASMTDTEILERIIKILPPIQSHDVLDEVFNMWIDK